MLQFTPPTQTVGVGGRADHTSSFGSMIGSAHKVTLTVQGTSPVPEASPTISFGLPLLLGLGKLVVCARRKAA